MNKFKFFLPLAALGLLASCSNDNLGDPNSGQTSPSQTELGDGAYININLAIPTVGSRADGDNEYNDGSANEFAINNAWIYFFEDDGNGNPTNCLVATQIDQYFDTTEDDANEITAFKKLENFDLKPYSSQLKTETDGNYKPFWALVILNKGGLTITPGETGQYSTFDAWASAVDDNATMMDEVNGVKYFTMTNALGWAITSAEGGTNKTISGNPTVLTQITMDNIFYKNQQGTKKDVEIFVQRGLAKVSIENKESSKIKIGSWCYTVNENPAKDVLDSETKGKKDYIYLTGWQLDNTNKKTYPAQRLALGTTSADQWWAQTDRNLTITSWADAFINATELARFVKLAGATPETKYARCFWGVDPNYNTELTADNISSEFNRVSGIVNLSNNAAEYCLENTFDVDHMIQEHTTRVILEGYYWPLVGETAPDIDPAEADAVEQIPSFISYNGRYVVPSAPLKLTTANLSENKTATIDKIFEARPTAYNAEMDVRWGSDQSLNGLEDAAKQAKILELEQDAWDENFDLVLKALKITSGSDAEINFHEHGHVYYTVLLRHFNDVETGLTNSPTLGDYLAYEGGILNVLYKTYPTNKDNYLLGRYGVLRNNWYELRLKSLSAMGSSYIPTPDKTTDDDQATLIDVDIYINAWAKRGQSVTFQ